MGAELLCVYSDLEPNGPLAGLRSRLVSLLFLWGLLWTAPFLFANYLDVGVAAAVLVSFWDNLPSVEGQPRNKWSRLVFFQSLSLPFRFQCFPFHSLFTEKTQNHSKFWSSFSANILELTSFSKKYPGLFSVNNSL